MTTLLYDAPADTTDEFDFRPVAQEIGAGLSSLSGRSEKASFVLGLEGKWGAGKSTIINYVKSYLRKDNPPLNLIDFDPWWFDSADNLAFNLLTTTIGQLPGRQLQKARAATARLGAALAKTPPHVTALLKLSKRTEGVASILDRARESGGDVEKLFSNTRTVRQLRDEIANEVAKSGLRFVIFIDDLDRLPPDQALKVLSLLRTTADVPGFTYLISYDSSALNNILGSASPPLGSEYLDKIVNLSVTVPPITQSQLLRFLKRRLRPEIAASLDQPATAGRQQAILSLLETPREAIRLANAVNFWSPSRVNELYIPDFLTLEAIRLVRAETYHGVYRTSDLWIKRESSFASRDRSDSSDTAVVERIERELALSKKSRDVHLRQCLGALFPHAAATIASGSYIEKPFSDLDSPDDRAIELPAHFWSYFLHRPLPGIPSRSELTTIVSRETSTDARTRLLADIASRDDDETHPLQFAFDSMDAELNNGKVDKTTALSFAMAICSLGHIISVRSYSKSGVLLSPLELARGVAFRSLRKAQPLSAEDIVSIVSSSDDISMLASMQMALTQGTQFYKLDDKGENPSIQADSGGLEYITEKTVSRIIKGFSSNKTFSSPIAPRLYYMAEKSDPQRTLTEIRKALTDDTAFWTYLNSFNGFNNPLPTVLRQMGIMREQLLDRIAELMPSLSRSTAETQTWYERLHSHEDDA